jgi:hypothetical protein
MRFVKRTFQEVLLHPVEEPADLDHPHDRPFRIRPRGYYK